MKIRMNILGEVKLKIKLLIQFWLWILIENHTIALLANSVMIKSAAIALLEFIKLRLWEKLSNCFTSPSRSSKWNLGMQIAMKKTKKKSGIQIQQQSIKMTFFMLSKWTTKDGNLLLKFSSIEWIAVQTLKNFKNVWSIKT